MYGCRRTACLGLLAVTLYLVTSRVAYCQQPRVEIVNTDPATQPSWKQVIGIRDDDVTMTCHVENLVVGTTLQWIRHLSNKSSELISKDVALIDNIRYTIDKPTPFDWRLRIRSVQAHDEGIYQCYVMVTLNTKISDSRTLLVHHKPEIDMGSTSPDITVLAGDFVDFVCLAGGRPDPVIEWSRFGNQLLPSGQEKQTSSHLHIDHVTPEERGIYRCTASNSMGIVRYNVQLKVYFKPTIATDTTTALQATDHPAKLTCRAIANPMPRRNDVVWLKENTVNTAGRQGQANEYFFPIYSSQKHEIKFIPLAFNHLTTTLTIDRVSSEDYGSYTCQIKNSIGSSTQRVQLLETSRPQPCCGGRPNSATFSHLDSSITVSVLFSIALFFLC